MKLYAISMRTLLPAIFMIAVFGFPILQANAQQKPSEEELINSRTKTINEGTGVAATHVKQLISRAAMAGLSFESADLFTGVRRSASQEYASAVREGVVMDLDPQAVKGLMETRPERMSLELPGPGERELLPLELIRVNVFAPGMSVYTSGNPGVPADVNTGIHYHGVFADGRDGFAAISIFDDQVTGMIVCNEGTYNLGRLSDSQRKHILYRERDLLYEKGFRCGTVSDGVPYTPEQLTPRPRRDAGDCVEIYIEVHENMYSYFSSDVQETVKFMVAIFVQNAILYANESINMRISEIFVWTTPSGYTGGAESMRNQWQAANDVYPNGDLIHFVAYTGSGAGGIAAGFDGLCNADVDEAVCVTRMFPDFNDVPTYSRQVKVFTHEMGHLLGSRHTHACVWNGNGTVIDSCADAAEGDCEYTPLTPVPGGGTIMSYCDTDGAGTIDFTKGFGTQPGDVIRASVAASGCTDVCVDENYLCPYATEVSCGNTYTGNTEGTTAADAPEGCTGGGIPNEGVWFTIPPNLGQYVRVETTDPTTDFDAQLNVYSGFDCESTFTCVTADDDSGVGQNALVEFAASQRSFIYLDGIAGATGDYELEVTCLCELPQAACKEDTVYLGQNGIGLVTVAHLENGSVADCGQDTILVDPDTLDCDDLEFGANVLLRIIDIYGNEDICIDQIKVLDTISPTAICRDVTLYLDTNLLAIATPDTIDFGSTDNCMVDELAISKDSFDCSDFGVNEVVLTVTDQSGNEDTCHAKVTIENNPNAEGLCCLDGETDNFYIAQVNEYMNGIFHASGDDNGYGDYTATVFDLANQYAPYLYLVFYPGSYGGFSLHNWEVYVDRNQDGVFDLSEKIVDYCTSIPNSQFLNFAGFPQGQFRMRVVMQSDTDNDGCQPGEMPYPLCGSIGDGEVEDYTVNKPYAWPFDVSGLSAADVLSADNVHVFPNPFSDRMMVAFEWAPDDPVEWDLLDVNGKSVTSGKQLYRQSGFEILTASLPSGLYILRIRTKDGVLTKSVVKQ